MLICKKKKKKKIATKTNHCIINVGIQSSFLNSEAYLETFQAITGTSTHLTVHNRQ